MSQEKNNHSKMKIVYEFAKKYLNDIVPSDIGASGLSEYFNIEKDVTTLQEITYSLLGSLQNTQMMPNVIALRSEDRAITFSEILFDYDCKKIVDNYNEEALYSLFCTEFTVNNKESKRNLWRRYTKSVLSAARFMSVFESAKDFDKFIMRFDYNELTSAALPMLLKFEIFGLGFPLACDFLKELGYSQYPKPDIHLIEIFSAFKFCDNNVYEVYKAVIKMAEINNDSAYNVDKTFWLISSGNFYKHNIKIGNHRAKFIQASVKELSKIH